MRLKFNETQKGKCYYIIRSIYKNGKNTSEIFERLGYLEDIKASQNCGDPMGWVKNRLNELNEAEREKKNITVLIPFDPSMLIPKNICQSFNAGYLFLQKIYYELRLDLICKHISGRHGFSYDLNCILSRLVYGRILYPGSKLSTFKQSSGLLEPPNFSYHQSVRALSVIAEEFDYIQSELYQYSSAVVKRKTGVLYYDCTNFYFETETEDDIENSEADESGIAARKYGISKQHQPSPLVQMGLFMDYSGIPLAICINRGNKNEQQTLIPLEEKILSDFELAKFVVCTDAGLSSEDNRKFNNFGERSFVTTTSIKGMNKELREWALSPTGWQLENEQGTEDISKIGLTLEDKEENYNKTYYKQKYITGYDEERDIEFNQTIIVTYSLKYKEYQRHKRNAQIERAKKAIDSKSQALEKKNTNDYRRFISKTENAKSDNKVKFKYKINEAAIASEEKFDGFYAVATNLDDDISEILKINHGRWEIEESFRIMKDDFRSRPVYLERKDRIKAHFMTCFISLLVYRILERKLDEKYTCDEITSVLKSLNLTKAKDTGYIPSYTRTDLTDALHDCFGFRTDYEIIRDKAMRGIIKDSKTRA